MPTINRDGVTIHYEVEGAGPTVLLTHGYSASAKMWRSNVPAIAAAGYQVITWDMRGHGESDSPDDPALYSAELTVGDIDAILTEVGVSEPAVIAGMSLGGFMTLSYHLAHREKCRGLMLIDTGPGFKKDEAREAWNVRARARAVDLLEKGEEALSASSEARLQPQNFLGLANAAKGMLAQSSGDAINSLPEIAVPTLVIVGDKDEPFLGAAEYMAKKIPNARKVTIADAGHASNIDQPEAFNAAVIEFLNAL